MVFARVVEAGSFTAAARLLGMPKTTVSRRIAALEREVGVRLVQRTTRSLNITDAGRLYYEQSSQALRTIEDANLRLAEARAEPSGTIRISVPVGFGGHFLASAAFHTQNPVRQPGLPRPPGRPGSVGGPCSPSLRHCGPIDRQCSLGAGRTGRAGNGRGVWTLRRQ